MAQYKIINFKAIAFIMGILLMIGGVFMLVGVPFSLYYKSGDLFALLASAAFTSFVGGLLYIATKDSERTIGKREAYLIVGLSYFVMSLFGSLPYLFSHSIPNFTNAYFETISGFTTTGATILNDIESVPYGVLTWRSMTQWMGGMGIILLTIAILPYFGIGGMELFVAEVPGPTKDKLHPRINETAKRLWYIYVALTLILTVLLYIEGMSVFDAFNHALTTASTGGFSTKQDSIGHWDSPIIQYTIILFMFLGGVNFTLHYFAIKGRFKNIIQNEEFKLYGLFVLLLSVMITITIVINIFEPAEETFRGVLFTVVSIVTTTGYTTVDYTLWLDFATLIFFFLAFSGGSAGSTSGGIKAVRHLMMVKNGIMEFKRMLHPRAIVPVRYNGKVVPENQIYNILAFFVIYMVVFLVSSFFMAALGSTSGMDMITAMSSVASSLGNVGPGIGEISPAYTFDHISIFGKWYLGILMVIGRLELFTILIIFTPYFWTRT